jgi:cell division protein FtsB
MQRAAMRLAYSNIPKGKGYNLAFKVIAEANTDLDHLDKTTRSHAVWMADPARRADIETWHARLPQNIRQQVNHPTAVYRRYTRETAAPTDGGGTDAKPPTLAQKQAASIAALQQENDALKRQIKRLETGADMGPQIGRTDTVADIVRVLEDYYPHTKLASIGSELIRKFKAREPRRASPKKAAD